MNKHIRVLLNFGWGLIRALFCIVGIPVIMWHVWKLYGWYVVDYKPYRGMKFSQEAWKKNKHGQMRGLVLETFGVDDRCRMYTDLTQNYLKKGMSVTQVNDLLGIEPLVSYCLEKRIKCVHYSLGTCHSGLTVSFGALFTCFDASQTLIAIGGQDFDEKLCDYKYAICGVGEPFLNLGCNCYPKTKRHIGPEKCKDKIEMW